MPSAFHQVLFLLLPALLLMGCQRQSALEITEVRKLPEKEQRPKLDGTSTDRFRFSPGVMQVQAQQEPSRGGARLAWDQPKGWQEIASAGMRQADFRFGAEGKGECYVMRAGGSLSANVNRWREQMGQPPLSEEEIANLPKRSIFGLPSTLVSVEGDYEAVGADEPAVDQRLLGVILAVPNSNLSLFVKMVGPSAEVAKEEANFHAFCDSLRITST
ncbi:MAG: hypothetical protein AAF191_05645 [Verrucomicrobiota bacterium]